jgi:hypothetical protein
LALRFSCDTKTPLIKVAIQVKTYVPLIMSHFFKCWNLLKRKQI